MSSSVHIDNRHKDILILGEGPTQGLDNTTLTAEAKYPISFTKSERRFVDATKIYQFKAKDSEIKIFLLCLGNISKDFGIYNMKKVGLKGSVKIFFC